MTSRVGKASNSQSGFADWIEARAARQGRRECGFADWIEAAPGHPSATAPGVALPPRRLFQTPFYLLHPWSRASMQSWPGRHSRILRISGAVRQGRHDGGFTYVVVLIMLIALGLAAGTATRVGSQRVQAEREAELLFRGLAYQRAIKSYYEATPPPNARALPRNFEDLLKDPRFQHRSHLRALYPDPFAPPGAGSDGWRVLRAEDGGILGVASRSHAEPLRMVNFPAGLEGLTGARTYADWQFVFTPPAPPLTTPPPGGTPQPPAASNRR